MNLLQERAEKLLSSLFPDATFWFADQEDPCPEPRDCLDVVLFGGFLRRFLESGNWPATNYRFWVLSEAVKNVMAGLLGIPEDSVTVIPRHLLFPFNPATRPFPPAEEAFDLVFAGRISAVKNIDMVVRTVHFLQKEQNVPARLVSIGSFDDEYHEDHGRKNHSGFEAAIRTLAAELEWNLPPLFLPQMGPEDWLKHEALNNPVFLTLSTFIFEDFGVSLAQAQSAGWPAIATHWGGHQEADCANTILLDPRLVSGTPESSWLVTQKARILAARLRMDMAEQRSKANENLREVTRCLPRELKPPRPISSSELDWIRRAFVRRAGPEIHMVLRHGISLFASTLCGREFFANYRQFFSGARASDAPICLVRGEDDLGAVQFCVDAFLEARRDVLFVPAKNLCRPRRIIELNYARAIVLPFLLPSVLPFLKLLIQDLAYAGRVIIVLNGGISDQLVDEARSILRKTDLLTGSFRGASLTR